MNLSITLVTSTSVVFLTVEIIIIKDDFYVVNSKEGGVETHIKLTISVNVGSRLLIKVIIHCATLNTFVVWY